MTASERQAEYTAASAPTVGNKLRAAIEADVLRRVADSLDWVRPEVSPCAPDFENCCGSESSCDAMQPSIRVIGAHHLRAEADRIEEGAR